MGVIHLARNEIADDEVLALERLVGRRWLMHPAGERFEIRDVEGVRVLSSRHAGPTTSTRVLGIHIAGASESPRAAVFDEHLGVGALTVTQGSTRPRRSRSRVGACFQELPESENGNAEAGTIRRYQGLNDVRAERLRRARAAERFVVARGMMT